jgi:signal transduction histidine kinase
VITTLNIKDDIIFFSVEDNGKGFDPAALPIKQSFGILGMKERVLSLNGKFELVSFPAKGTKISISLPYKTDIPT